MANEDIELSARIRLDENDFAKSADHLSEVLGKAFSGRNKHIFETIKSIDDAGKSMDELRNSIRAYEKELAELEKKKGGFDPKDYDKALSSIEVFRKAIEDVDAQLSKLHGAQDFAQDVAEQIAFDENRIRELTTLISKLSSEYAGLQQRFATTVSPDTISEKMNNTLNAIDDAKRELAYVTSDLANYRQTQSELEQVDILDSQIQALEQEKQGYSDSLHEAQQYRNEVDATNNSIANATHYIELYNQELKSQDIAVAIVTDKLGEMFLAMQSMGKGKDLALFEPLIENLNRLGIISDDVFEQLKVDMGKAIPSKVDTSGIEDMLTRLGEVEARKKELAQPIKFEFDPQFKEEDFATMHRVAENLLNTVNNTMDVITGQVSAEDIFTSVNTHIENMLDTLRSDDIADRMWNAIKTGALTTKDVVVEMGQGIKTVFEEMTTVSAMNKPSYSKDLIADYEATKQAIQDTTQALLEAKTSYDADVESEHEYATILESDIVMLKQRLNELREESLWDIGRTLDDADDMLTTRDYDEAFPELGKLHETESDLIKLREGLLDAVSKLRLELAELQDTSSDAGTIITDKIDAAKGEYVSVLAQIRSVESDIREFAMSWLDEEIATIEDDYDDMANPIRANIRAMQDELKAIASGTSDVLQSDKTKISELSLALDSLQEKLQQLESTATIQTYLEKPIVDEKQSQTLDEIVAKIKEINEEGTKEDRDQFRGLLDKLHELGQLSDDTYIKLSSLLKVDDDGSSGGATLNNLQALESTAKTLSGGNLESSVQSIGSLAGKLGESLGSAEGAGAGLAEALGGVAAAAPYVAAAIGILTVLKKAIDAVVDKVKEKIQETVDFVKNAFDRTVGVVKFYINAIKENVMSVIGLFDGAIQSIGTSIKNLPMKIFNGYMNLLKANANAISKSFSKLTTQFKQFIVAGLGVRSITMLYRKFWDAIKSSMKDIASVDKDINDAITRIKTQLNQIKGQISALGSIFVTAFAPIIETVLAKVQVLAENITKLFALLMGQKSYKKATSEVQQYADSLEDSANSANKALGAYDKLNVIGQQGGGDAQGTGSGLSFEDIEIEESLSDLLDKDWYAEGIKVADQLADGIISFADMLKAKDVKGKVVQFCTDVSSFIRGFFAKKKLWKSLGDTAGYIVDSISQGLSKIFGTGGVDFVFVGEKFKDAIIAALEVVDWSVVGDTLAGLLTTIPETILGGIATMSATDVDTLIQSITDELNQFIQGVDNFFADKSLWENSSKNLSDSITGIVEGIKWDKIGKLLADGLNDIVIVLKNFFGSDGPVGKLGVSFNDVIQGFIDNTDWDTLATTLSDNVNTIVQVFFDITAPDAPIWQLGNQIMDSLTDTINGIDSDTLGTTLANAINGMVDWVYKWLSSDNPYLTFGDKMASAIGESIENINWEEAGLITQMLLVPSNLLGFLSKFDPDEVGTAVGDFVNGIIQGINEQIFDANLIQIARNLIDALSKAFETVTENNQLSQLTDNLVNFIGDAIDLLLEKLPSFLQDFVIPLITKFTDVIIDIFETIADNKDLLRVISDVIFTIIDGFVGVWTKLMDEVATNDDLQKALANIIISLATGLVTAVAAVKVGTWKLIITAIFDAIRANINENSIADIAMFIIDGLVLGLKGAITKRVFVKIFEKIITFFKNVFGINSPSKVMEEQGHFIIQGLLNGFKGLAKLVGEKWKAAKEKIVTIWNKLKDKVTRISDKVKTTLSDTFETMKTELAEKWELIKTTLANTWTNLKTSVVDTAKEMRSKVLDKVEGWKTKLTEKFDLMKQNITTKFSAIKTNLVSIFSSMWEKIKPIINSMLGGLETLTNGAIMMLNKILDGVNKVANEAGGTIRDLFNIDVPELNLQIPEISIPRLAQGAVLPANKPFMAMVGDQKYGTNIEAPLDTIKQAVAEVLSEINFNVSGGNNAPIVLQLSGKQIAKAVWDETDKRYKQTGKAY